VKAPSPVVAEVRAVLKELNGNRVALAAEIVKLRTELESARYEISRLAATGTAYRTISPPPSGLPPQAGGRPGLGYGP
jgi:hypothetical protein